MRKICLIILLVGYFNLNAQTPDPIDTDAKNLYFKFEATSFFKDNEYFGAYSKGFTGLGYFIKPHLSYTISSKTKVSLGIHLLQYAGTDKFSEAIPIFSIEHQINSKINMILGSIHSTSNHNLEEQLFRSDLFYQDNVEYGIQFLWRSKYFKSDLWLDWEKFIQKNDPFNEEFIIGLNTKQIIPFSNKTELSIKFQSILTHSGGQIDQSNLPISTIINSLTGPEYIIHLHKESKISAELLWGFYKGFFPDYSALYPYKWGQACRFKISYNNKHFTSTIAYWKSNKFIAPNGEYLFQSISDFDSDFAQEKRNVIVANLSFERNIGKCIHFEIRGNSYFDTDVNHIDFSMSFYFIFKEIFFLKSF